MLEAIRLFLAIFCWKNFTLHFKFIWKIKIWDIWKFYSQFVQETYHPAQWRHRHSVANKTGVLKTNKDELKSYDIAGPLCFQGDFLAKEVLLPNVEAGDILIIHDTGAYSFSFYSRYLFQLNVNRALEEKNQSSWPSAYFFFTLSPLSSHHFARQFSKLTGRLFTANQH